MAVLDLGLPVMDGYELARRLADECQACSAIDRRHRLRAATGSQPQRGCGFAAHLVKPVDIGALHALIETKSV